MGFNPSEVRAPAGSASGGQWTVGDSPTSKQAPAKKTAAPAKGNAKSGAGKAPSKAPPKMGPARNAAAAKIQQDKEAQQLYRDMMAMQTGEQAREVQKLPAARLEKLAGILYSSPTSDPDVVKARIVVANEMGKRGLDVKKYGAVGGGATSPRRVTAAQAKVVAHAKARTASSVAARKKAPAQSALKAPTAAGGGMRARAI